MPNTSIHAYDGIVLGCPGMNVWIAQLGGSARPHPTPDNLA